MDQRGLIERAKRGDHDAFAALVDVAIARLDAAARLILRDSELAHDAVQDALLRAWRDLRGLRDPDRFDAWLYRLTVNSCFSLLRRRRRRPIEVELTSLDAPARADLSTEYVKRELLDDALRSLDPPHRAVVALHYLLGLPLHDVADALEIPIGTVKSRLHYSIRTRGPVFSRDGTELAFFRGEDGAETLWVMDVDGGSPRSLPLGSLTGLDAIEGSPDGRSILVTTNAGTAPGMAIVATSGEETARVLDVSMSAESPRWRPPEGREILFRGHAASGFGLYAVHPDGTGFRAVTATDGDAEWDALFYDWSPDGTRVAYQWREGDGPQLIYVIAADGGDPLSITRDESVGAFWSPDGAQIAFYNGSQRLSVVPADGSGPAIAVTNNAPGGLVRWSPDGKRLLFSLGESDTPNLLDPVTRSMEPARWSGDTFDWQRLAP